MTPEKDGEDETAGTAETDRGEEDLIGRNLKRLFNHVEREDLPDDLKALLQKLADEERRRK